MISASYWLFLESLTYTYIPLLILMVALLFFIFFFILLYKKENKIKISSILILFTISLLTLYFYLDNSYSEDFKRIETPSPALQYKKRKLGGYYYFKQVPPKLMDEKLLQTLGIYSSEYVETTEGITYLGATEHLHYFKIYDVLYKINLQSPYIEFSDQIKTETFVGDTYKLKDAEFESIGFYNEVGPLYQKLVIPQEKEGLIFQHNGQNSKNYNFEFVEKEASINAG